MKIKKQYGRERCSFNKLPDITQTQIAAILPPHLSTTIPPPNSKINFDNKCTVLTVLISVSDSPKLSLIDLTNLSNCVATVAAAAAAAAAAFALIVAVCAAAFVSYGCFLL